MGNETFNLVTEPWIKVIELDSNQTRTVSLLTLFKNAQRYRQLAGEMESQDLAILRLLLAILTTVYSRFETDGTPYSWLDVDMSTLKATGLEDEDEYEEKKAKKDLLRTWQQLYQAGHFSDILEQYLDRYKDDFDLFGNHPFYQVTTDEYDALVPKNKSVASGKGQVTVKQINRRISESNNQPAIFAPKSDSFKNKLKLDEFARWLITYQNFTGVTDKTKIEVEDKFSNSAGWLYQLNSVYVSGQTLFETLLLNLVLVGDDLDPKNLQKPVWEYGENQAYVTYRKKQIKPDNLAELYTTWSRVLHVEWQETVPIHIFSAGLPIFETENMFIEPMTTWKKDKKTGDYRPAKKYLSNMSKSMWRNFGQYVSLDESNDDHEPNIVKWLRKLKNENIIPDDKLLVLASSVLVSDGNATSQLPVVESADDMRIQADVLFDDDKEYWPRRIESTIDLTQKIGTAYYYFISDISKIRGIDGRDFSSQMSATFYERLNEPFKDWLAGLSNQDDRDQKVNEWKDELQDIAYKASEELIKNSTPRDIKGVMTEKGVSNIFTVSNLFRYKVKKNLWS